MAMSETLKEKRSSLLSEAQSIVDAAEAEKRDLTADEDGKIADALKAASDLDGQIAKHEELEARTAAAKAIRKEQGVAVVKAEPRTYTQRSGHSFISDAYRAQFNNDYAAQERLARHMREEQVERRDVTSSNFAGLIVPQFLTELAAPFARAGRPLADRARKHQLPADGLTISISKVTTGSAVAEQTEGLAVQETNMDDTKLDISVKTIAGQQNVSRQAIERGTNIDSLVMADLVSAYHTTLDNLLVAQMRTDVVAGGNVVSYTDASPSVAELYPKLADAVQKVQTTFFAGPNAIVMHPRRLAFILASLDLQNRPLAVPAPNFNSVANGDGAPVYGNSGYTIMGLPVITDANVSITQGPGNNEDNIYVGNLQEVHLWEEGNGEPMMLRFEQPKAAELDVTMIVYGYSAFTVNRYPKSWAIIDGTGLVTPTF
jgi:HK97 family phage major capsid protein